MAATICSGVAEVRGTGAGSVGVLAQPANRRQASARAWIDFMRTTRWAGESAAALQAARAQAAPAAAARARAEAHGDQTRTIRASRVARLVPHRHPAPDRRTGPTA